jgi:hypothetical protein
MEIKLNNHFTLSRGEIPGTCNLTENILGQDSCVKNRELREIQFSIQHTVSFIALNKLGSVESVENAVIAEAFEKITMDHIDEVTQVGCGVGMAGYSDVYCGTIISRSKDGKRLKVRTGIATLLNGVESGEADALTFSPGGFVGHTEGVQRYSYEDDPNGSITEFSYRPKSGYYCQKGSKGPFSGGLRLILGGYYHKHDYNF